mmetsp:Transcript_38419/g.70969  ORF Transcript_38419/g.70969 Transcript_38419/m.70969 type:complete len:153 (-) Transcript_38419:28-486(-)
MHDWSQPLRRNAAFILSTSPDDFRWCSFISLPSKERTRAERGRISLPLHPIPVPFLHVTLRLRIAQLRRRQRTRDWIIVAGERSARPPMSFRRGRKRQASQRRVTAFDVVDGRAVSRRQGAQGQQGGDFSLSSFSSLSSVLLSFVLRESPKA